MDEIRFDAFINPLAFTHVDPERIPNSGLALTPESALSFLCTPGMRSDVVGIVERYREMGPVPVQLAVVPAEQRLLDKLIWPLRHARASYCVGNFLGVIALCGTVAEMLAILVWDLSEPTLNGRRMTKADEKALLGGGGFERLGQERRVEVLSAYGLISLEAKTEFSAVREIRRRYLHLWSQDHDVLPADAIRTFQATVRLMALVLGQEFQHGKVVLSPRLVKYLERQGRADSGAPTV
jgi:hypothetical protein